MAASVAGRGAACVERPRPTAPAPRRRRSPGRAYVGDRVPWGQLHLRRCCPWIYRDYCGVELGDVADRRLRLGLSRNPPRERSCPREFLPTGVFLPVRGVAGDGSAAAANVSRVPAGRVRASSAPWWSPVRDVWWLPVAVFHGGRMPGFCHPDSTQASALCGIAGALG